ncbi:hypothetical protein [Streptomyces sp. NPDC000410]|uniref:effector-associated constant component EACC1 n=1 Tax=Streptomyces sp. NPDC000410 TaxID=3154254 RepID=UPI00333262A3
MTDILVGVDDSGRGDGAEEELRSLLRWVNEDESLVHDVRGRIAPGPPPAPGTMGTGFEVLQFALATGLSTAALVVSVLQWQIARRGTPDVILRRGEVEVRLTRRAARDAATVSRVAALLDGHTAVIPGAATPAVPVPATPESADDGGTA